jgi:hypothetical protein
MEEINLAMQFLENMRMLSIQTHWNLSKTISIPSEWSRTTIQNTIVIRLFYKPKRQIGGAL